MVVHTANTKGQWVLSKHILKILIPKQNVMVKDFHKHLVDTYTRSIFQIWLEVYIYIYIYIYYKFLNQRYIKTLKRNLKFLNAFYFVIMWKNNLKVLVYTWLFINSNSSWFRLARYKELNHKEIHCEKR